MVCARRSISCIIPSGFSYITDEAPLMCFNGPKTYQLGWYSNYHVDLSVANNFNWNGNLVGFAENRAASASDKMIVRIISATDTYIHFNRKVGSNAGTQEGGDKVLVTTRSTGLAGNAQSTLVAKLSTGDVFTIPNFNGTSYTLSISVNSISTGTAPARASVSAPVDHVNVSPQTFPLVLRFSPSPAPIQPTPAPINPTLAPIEPTPAPIQSHPCSDTANISPNKSDPCANTCDNQSERLRQSEPTSAPVSPTPAPIQPTPAPISPTPAPIRPTASSNHSDSCANQSHPCSNAANTSYPIRRTPAPIRRTPAPTSPTPAPPIEPTAVPNQSHPSSDTTNSSSDQSDICSGTTNSSSK
jgi:hypothetical protein